MKHRLLRMLLAIRYTWSGQAKLCDQSTNFTLPIWVIGINFFRVMFFGGNIVSSEIFQLGFVVLISDKKHTIN